MKKIIIILSAIVAFALNVLATPYAWVDTIKATSAKDSIYSNTLKHKLYDDGGNNIYRKSAVIDHLGIVGNEFYNYNYSTSGFGLSLAELIQLTEAGKNVITISSVTSNLYNGNIHLTAFGTDAAPVPESGSMVLLGFGLLGFAIYGKRRINKEV